MLHIQRMLDKSFYKLNGVTSLIFHQLAILIILMTLIIFKLQKNFLIKESIPYFLITFKLSYFSYFKLLLLRLFVSYL